MPYMVSYQVAGQSANKTFATPEEVDTFVSENKAGWQGYDVYLYTPPLLGIINELHTVEYPFQGAK